MAPAIPQALHLFPVRHHSPRASAVLRAHLDQVRPRVVLVEGPADATALIPTLVDPETRPPVAVLGYRTDGTPGSALWPFAAYSPEYVALAWAAANGATAEFIDVTIGQSLAAGGGAERDGAAEREGEAERDGAAGAGAEADGAPQEAPLQEASLAEPRDRPDDVHLACARARGFRSFEEFWEASFEAPAYDAADFRAAILAYADLVRAEAEGAFHRARDAAMTRRIHEVLARGVDPAEVAVVVGAAHAAAFVAGDVDPALEATLPEPVASAATVIPYSFPRLAEQLGYGAGNRAPQYYQRAHDAGCDFRRATLEVLVEFSEHLRLRGFAVSLADTIEAYRLAVMLADIRGKAGPGLDEVREATVATMCRGERAHVDGFLWPAVIGRHVGKVAARVGRNSLQEEFWREVRSRKLPETDSPEQFVLKLDNDVEVATSVFLHRLRVAGVPYAAFLGTQRAGPAKAGAEPAGGYAALSRVREAWEAQWTPATDVALVEQIVLGDGLEQVATRRLEEQLAAAGATGAAADVLMESVVAACPQTIGTALSACDAFASADDDLPSLARACRALSGLVAYGSSRARSAAGDEAIPRLCTKTFDRALLRVTDACTGTDEAVREAREALRTLHEIALAQPLVDRAAWLAAARALVESYAVNPSASGLACGLLYLAQAISDGEVALFVGQRLSNTLEPEAAAGFLEGFLAVNSAVLVKSRPVVQALDAFLCAIEPARFTDLLPVLRRALGPLGQTERRYLLEHVVALRGLGEQAQAAQAVIAEKDKEKLKQMNADLAKAMDDLDDLL